MFARKSARTAAAIAVVIGVVALAALGERVAPPAKAPVGEDLRKRPCDVDAPQALHAAAKQWCANGLFSRVAITGDDHHVIAVMQFTPNGAQTWELQSGLLTAEFRGLANQLASAANGKDVSIALHDAADRRVGACARTPGEASATCSNE